MEEVLGSRIYARIVLYFYLSFENYTAKLSQSTSCHDLISFDRFHINSTNSAQVLVRLADSHQEESQIQNFDQLYISIPVQSETIITGCNFLDSSPSPSPSPLSVHHVHLVTAYPSASSSTVRLPIWNFHLSIVSQCAPSQKTQTSIYLHAVSHPI